MRLHDFKVLTFDCYGTLIDWESGLYQALEPWLQRHHSPITRAAALETFARVEAAQQAATPKLLYSQLLAEVHKTLAQQWGLPVDEAAAKTFGESIKDWPAFPDSAPALGYLKKHYQLVILSNVDNDSFRHSNAKLGVDFDAIYTAQDIGSYKPDPANFAYLLKRLGERGVTKNQILHTAQSLFHDHVPAKHYGLATAWIDRHGDQPSGERPSTGATPPPPQPVAPDFRFRSLAEFVQHHQAER